MTGITVNVCSLTDYGEVIHFPVPSVGRAGCAIYPASGSVLYFQLEKNCLEVSKVAHLKRRVDVCASHI